MTVIRSDCVRRYMMQEETKQTASFPWSSPSRCRNENQKRHGMKDGHDVIVLSCGCNFESCRLSFVFVVTDTGSLAREGSSSYSS